MKKLAVAFVILAATAANASAADLAARPYAKAPPMVAPAYTWTGCYVGVEGGGSVGRSRSVSDGLNNGIPTPTAGALKSNVDLSGGLAGGTLGCNYQVNQWVFGIEGDASWAGNSGSAALIAPFNRFFNEDPSEHWLATVRGRVGYVVGGNVLIYGTAGGAFADLRIHEYSTVIGDGATETHDFAGWTAGGGVEWGFAPHWTAKLEYLYVDLGNQTYFAATANRCCTEQTTHLTDNIVRASVDYHFNWSGPVVARY